MRFRTDSRAQSIQIGAVLLFGVLIILLSTWQAFVVPDQNEEIEFNHNQDVQQQMTDLRSTVISMPGADTPQSSTVDLGLRYPSRTIFRNPPPVSGTIQTTETTDERYNVSIINAEPENDDLALLWDRDGSSYNSGAIEYRPRYNEYRNAPRTIYSNTVLFNRFDREEQQLPITGQSLIRDNRISIVALNGSLSENRVESSSIDFEPVSTQTREVEIKPEADEQITLEFPTRMGENRWTELFAGEPNVEDVSVDGTEFEDEELGLLTIELAAEPAGDRDTYRLRLSKLGVGTDVTQTNRAYLTDIRGNGTTIDQGERTTLTVEVRDEYNKPESGIEVDAAAEGGIFTATGEDGATKETDSEGRAEFQYEGEIEGDNEIDFTANSEYTASDPEHDTSKPLDVTMVVEVTERDQTETDPGAYAVEWRNPDGQSGTVDGECDADSCTFDGSDDDDLDLTMFTSPEADGADVEYNVGNRNIALVEPETGTTNEGGEDTTTFKPRQEGTVNVFTSSGSDGDRIEVEIINLDNVDLTIEPNTENAESTHTWTIDDLPFRGEVDNITAAYPDRTDFGPVTNEEVTVELTNDGDEEKTEVSVNNDDYDGAVAVFDLDGREDSSSDGPASVEIQDLINPDADEYEATLTFRGPDDTFEVTAEFETTESEAKGTVDIQEPISETDESFEVDYTFENTEGDDAFLVVENEDTGGSETRIVDDADGEGTAVIEASDVDGLNADDTITATLYESEDEENELAFDDTVVEAAELTLEAENEIIDPGESNELTASYKPDAELEWEVTSSFEGQLEDVDDQTDADGEATATYNSDEDDAGNEIEIQVEAVDDDQTATETFEVRGADEITEGQADPDPIEPGEETTISAVVRDQFGDEFEGEEITFESDGAGGFADGTDISDENGEVSDVYTADEDDGGEEVTITLSAPNSDNVAPVDVKVTVELMADNAEVIAAEAIGEDSSEVQFTFENQADNAAIEIDGIALESTTSEDADNVNNGGDPELTFTEGGQLNVGGGNDVIEIDGTQYELGTNENIAAGDDTQGDLVQFVEEGAGQSGEPIDMSDENVVMTLFFTDGSSETYTLELGLV